MVNRPYMEHLGNRFFFLQGSRAGICGTPRNPWIRFRKTILPYFKPRCSMYGLFTYIWIVLGVNAGKYTIHWAFGKGIWIGSGIREVCMGGNGGFDVGVPVIYLDNMMEKNRCICCIGRLTSRFFVDGSWWFCLQDLNPAESCWIDYIALKQACLCTCT